MKKLSNFFLIIMFAICCYLYAQHFIPQAKPKPNPKPPFQVQDPYPKSAADNIYATIHSQKAQNLTVHVLDSQNKQIGYRKIAVPAGYYTLHLATYHYPNGTYSLYIRSPASEIIKTFHISH